MKTMMEEIKEELDKIYAIGEITDEDSNRDILNDCITDMMNAISDLKSLIDSKFPNV